MRLYEFRRAKRVVWRRSSYCAAGECAELLRAGNEILLRSSQQPKVIVKYTPEEFRALRLGFQAGEFDDIDGPA